MSITMQNGKTGIFLTGGGGIGSFHIGFLKALEEEGIKFDFICGSSAGAIVSGAATYMSADEIHEAWKKLSLENVLKIDSKKIESLEGFRRKIKLYEQCFLSCVRRNPNLMIDANDIRKLFYGLLDGSQMEKLIYQALVKLVM